MKKKDIILIAAVLVIALISFAAIKMTQKDGKEVVVTSREKKYTKHRSAKTRSTRYQLKMEQIPCRSKTAKSQ